MTAILTMPRMGETMESGRVVAWLKRPGEAFKRGEVLLEIETDKTTVEMPALDDGRLVEILAQEGAEIAVGEALGRYDGTDGGGTAPNRPSPGPAPALQALTLPRMGETMQEGRIVAWLKRPGDLFKRGELLLELETDKTTVEVPALEDGRLVDIAVEAGASVAVGEPIGHFEPQGGSKPEPVAASRPVAPAIAPFPADDAVRPEPQAAQTAQIRLPDATRFRATPLARRLARAGGIDLDGMTGTGRRGRIGKADVEAAMAGAAPAQVSTPDVRFAVLPQGRVAYREWAPAGAVRGTMLFLHGFGADGATWAGFAAALARQGTRVIAPDLPGHGATELSVERVDDAVEASGAFAASLGLAGFDIVAHSMGAAIAVRAVAGNHLRPERMTLLAPAGLSGEIDADFIAGMAHATSPGALAHLLRRLARKPPALSRPTLDRMAAEFGRGRLRGLAADLVEGGRQAIDIVPDLRTLSVPTRIVWGLDDRIIPWTQAAEAPSRTPIHLIAGAGHMPHWDEPQELAALFA